MIKNAKEAGADNLTPSIPQYFSWINNTNEGSTEEHTLVNLDFFKYLKEKYGMEIKIYAWDAGNFDGASEGYGNLNSEKFKSQYPEGYKNVVKKAEECGIRMGLWGSPDGYGDDEKTRSERYNFFVHLCRDYGFMLFKLDGVCGQLRPEKAKLFSDMLTECRKYSPNLIVLNHRLNLYEAEKNVTTFLFNGQETYVDVLSNNSITAMHNRAFMFSRGHVDNLDRLAEDHGVCLSSCLDYFEDELIYQAFGRCLILAPEIYGNPWLLKDEEYKELAKVYNLHKRNADILVNGIKLPEKYGPDAVSRGTQSKRFITTGNDSWEKKVLTFIIGEEIGINTSEKVNVNIHNPYVQHIGTYNIGDEVSVELMPFRATLIEVSAESVSEKVIKDKTYKTIVESQDGTPQEIKVFAFEGCDHTEKAPELLTTLTDVTEHPVNAEELYETAVFAANNDSLEYRSLIRSGETSIPEVKKCRDMFFNQETYKIRGCESRNMFDGDEHSFFDGKSRTYQQQGVRLGDGCLRIDFGNAYSCDRVEITCFATNEPTPEILEQLIPESGSFSIDMKSWKETGKVEISVLNPNETMRVVKTKVHTVYDNKGKRIKLVYPVNGNIRYLRLPSPPDRIFCVKLIKDDCEIMLDKNSIKANNLQLPFGEYKTEFAISGDIILPAFREGSRLAIAINGKYEDESAWTVVEKDGVKLGCPNRAPEFKGNVWEHRVTDTDGNYTYFYPLDNCKEGNKLTVTTIFASSNPEDMDVKVYLCDKHRI